MTAPKSTVGRRWQAGFFLTPPRTSRFTPVPSLTIRLTVSTQNSIADQVMGVGGDGRRWADGCASALPHIRGMVQAEARRALLYYGAATANEQSTVKASLGHRLPRPPAHRQPKAEAPEYSVSTACLSLPNLPKALEGRRQKHACPTASMSASLSHPRSMRSTPSAHLTRMERSTRDRTLRLPCDSRPTLAVASKIDCRLAGPLSPRP